MARRSGSKAKSRHKINWKKRAAKIRRFRSLPFSNTTNFTPAQKAKITHLWFDTGYKYRSPANIRKVGKIARKKLKDAGFDVEEKGLVLEPPRDARGNRIKGVRISASKKGVVRQSVGKRTDYAVPVEKKDLGEIVRRKDPENLIRQILKKAGVPAPGNTNTKTYKRKKTRVRMRLNINGNQTGIMAFKDISRYLAFMRSKDPNLFRAGFIAIEVSVYHVGKKKKRRKK